MIINLRQYPDLRTMVVLDCGFGEFEVAIECNGRILQEYASGPVSATRQQCHIASEENKVAFGVYLAVS